MAHLRVSLAAAALVLGGGVACTGHETGGQVDWGLEPLLADLVDALSG